MALGQWLRREKILRGLWLLAAGESVDSVALGLGYKSASAFIAMFRRMTGVSPTSRARRLAVDQQEEA